MASSAGCSLHQEGTCNDKLDPGDDDEEIAGEVVDEVYTRAEAEALIVWLVQEDKAAGCG